MSSSIIDEVTSASSYEIPQIVTRSILCNDYLKEYYNLCIERANIIEELSWKKLSDKELTDVKENYIPKKIAELEQILKDNKVMPEGFDEKLLNHLNIDFESKKVFRALLYYLGISNSEYFTKAKVNSLYRLIKTLAPRPIADLPYPIDYPVQCPACKEIYLIKLIDWQTAAYDNGLKCSCGHSIYFIKNNEEYKSMVNKSCYCDICKDRYSELNKKVELLVAKWLEYASDIAWDILAKKEEVECPQKSIDDYLYNKYMIHRNNLNKTARFFINLKIDDYNDLLSIVNSNFSNSSKIINTLNKYSIIHEISSYTCFNRRDIITNRISSWFRKEFVWNGGLNIYEFAENEFDPNSKSKALEKMYIEKISDGVMWLDYKYILNPHYFNTKNNTLSKTKYNVLKSNAEKCSLNELLLKYPEHIVLPNYRLSEILNVYDFSDEFNDNELQYLRNCILDFVIIDKEGYVVKVIECQKGNHHDEADWVVKDNLKKNILYFAGVPFEETF